MNQYTPEQWVSLTRSLAEYSMRELPSAIDPVRGGEWRLNAFFNPCGDGIGKDRMTDAFIADDGRLHISYANGWQESFVWREA